MLVSVTIAENDSSVGKTIDEVEYPRDAAKIIAIYDGEKLCDPAEIDRLRPNYEIIALVRRDVVENFIEAFR